MRELVESIAKALVDEPRSVDVAEVEGEDVTVIELRVARTDCRAWRSRARWR